MISHLAWLEVEEQRENKFRRDSASLLEAATALIDDVRRRHPGEDLKCPHMIKLDEAVRRFKEPNHQPA